MHVVYLLPHKSNINEFVNIIFKIPYKGNRKKENIHLNVLTYLISRKSGMIPIL